MTKGKLIVFEAGDGCGKSTQAGLLGRRLSAAGHAVREISFPDYQSPSSALIKMYLGGEFGVRAADVPAHPASLFYTVDRLASFYGKWGVDYHRGGIIIADRYTTSNLVHQAAKIDHPGQRADFVGWLIDLEYEKCRLPRPDLVIYLDLPTAMAVQLIASRQQSSGGRLDIHERDSHYLEKCRQCGLWLADRLGWRVVGCLNENGRLKSAAEIHDTIFREVEQVLVI
ncbi:MAG: thymidylate kinase [Negativicutes bacterium]|nr:thymidylate kinase [Negativicutes bacterium]